jgi:aminoglycoside phosphotransferase (APT) family kinase protein
VPAPRERDFEQARKDLAAWLGAKLPEATDLELGPLSGPGLTGFSSDTFLFDASWREDGREQRQGFVVRLRPSGFPVFPAYDIAKQFHIQRALADTDVPTARMFWLEEDERFLGAPFYLMGRVDGRIPPDSPTYHQDGWLKQELAPQERADLWWSGLEALAAIHRVDWRARGLDLLRPDAPIPLDFQLDSYERMLRWAGGRPKPVLEQAFAWLRTHQPRDEEPEVISWGDARIGNMIFDGTRCAAVLDWEMAGIASPELDLAWWIYIDRHHSEGAGAPRLEGLPDREATVARYEALTGHRVRHLDYYEVFGALRFAVIMVRLAQQFDHYGLLPADSRFEVDNTASRLLATVLDIPVTELTGDDDG